VVINLPPPWGKYFLNGVEEWRIRWEEKWHHPVLAANHSVTVWEWWNATWSHTITNVGIFRLTATLSSTGTTLP
jgi:hypothetical protein